MKCNRIVLIGMIISILIGSTALANLPENELKNQIIEVNRKQLESLGFKFTNNNIDVITKDIITNSSANKIEIKRKLRIKKNGINLLSPNKLEKSNRKVFPIRMAVLSWNSNTVSYYSKISDADKYLIKDKQDVLTNKYLSDNNWKALHYKTMDNKDLYLWFDANDLEKMPEEIEHTPPPFENSEFLSEIILSPNPTRNGKAEISFLSNQSLPVSITMYDITGQKVLNILTNTIVNSGKHKFIINGEELPDGMYLIVIQNDKGESITKKLIKTS